MAMIAFFYFAMIRPENKRKKEAEEMRASVRSGDRVTTIGGVTGVVVDVKEDKFVIETGADRVRVEFAKFALSENHTASERAAAESKKAKEKAAKEKAAKKAEK
jgi:preprotein translocase subunit YajC